MSRGGTNLTSELITVQVCIFKRWRAIPPCASQQAASSLWHKISKRLVNRAIDTRFHLLAGLFEPTRSFLAHQPPGANPVLYRGRFNAEMLHIEGIAKLQQGCCDATVVDFVDVKTSRFNSFQYLRIFSALNLKGLRWDEPGRPPGPEPDSEAYWNPL